MSYSGYEMKYKGDCGLAAIVAATGKDYKSVSELYPIDVSQEKKIDDLYDNYLVHWDILVKLGFKFREVSFDELISGKCESGKTIILIHALDDPETWVPEDLINQHYVIFNEIKDGRIYVDWGVKPLIRSFKIEDFKKLYEGYPTQIAYTITGENLRSDLTKWEKIKLWIFLQLMKIIKVFVK